MNFDYVGAGSPKPHLVQGSTVVYLPMYLHYWTGSSIEAIFFYISLDSSTMPGT